MAKKPSPASVVTNTRYFESSKKDVEKKPQGKEGSKREEKFDTSLKRKGK